MSTLKLTADDSTLALTHERVSTPPQGEHDEFSSVATLNKMVGRAAGKNRVVVVPEVGHFELESPAYDDHVAELTISWLRDEGLTS